ncbi:hypothetical protein E4U42_007031 [Claviceps africana]|uniref:Ankyrin n=1 Tax=Claviceps africana TaxID=83212 RepID=A0A8K0JB39_9HYPO|nr:hypothetical protein E4U42_007031 [Claviceps africana]
MDCRNYSLLPTCASVAATQKSVLRCTLEDSIASIASVLLLPQLKMEATQHSGIVREQLDMLRDEMRWILGVVSGLHQLVQCYEDDGQTLNTDGPYVFLERLIRFLANTREDLGAITPVVLQSTLRSLEPYLSLVALACDDANTLSGIHHRLASDIGPQSVMEQHVAEEIRRLGLEKASCGLHDEDDKSRCPPRRRLAESLTTESCDDATLIRWMQELNFPGHGRPPLQLFSELCLVRARSRQRPLYRVAASEWCRYADARWSVIRCEAEKLFSDPQRYNFIQWVLEFARARLPDSFECAGQPERAARIIELTNELEQGTLTPLHVSSMLGMSELCKSLLSRGPVIDSAGSLGSPLYCALWGPQILVQLKQPTISWPTMLEVMEPANNDTIRALVSSGTNFGSKPRSRLENRRGATIAGLGFVASVKARNHEIFQSIMKNGGSLDESLFSTILHSIFPAGISPDLRDLVARLYAIVLGYNLVLRCDQWPWERQDDIGLVVRGMMDQNHLSLPRNFTMSIPAMTDDDFDLAVRGCVLNGDDMYLQRLALDDRFNANLPFDRDGMENGTILHVVVSGQHYKMLPVLASYAADFCAVDARGRTPLMVVEDAKMLRLLVKRYHVSTESTDIDGRNIWHYAAATNDKNIMEWLCENDPSRKANINSITKQGYSPLIESLLYINTLLSEIRHTPPTRPHVAYMLLQQEDLDVTRGSADLPLGHIAVQWGESGLVNLLVQKGVNFAALDRQGRSPLHHLNASAEPELVRRLVELCGGLPVLSRAGATPFESLYANSFFAEPGGCFSNHPSSFKAISWSIIQPLLTRDVLDAHNAAGQGCWALFCNTARHCFERCAWMEQGIPDIVHHSFWTGLLCLHKHHALEAHEEETGRPAILSLASLREDGTTRWSLIANSLISKTLQVCFFGGMKQFFHTQHAYGLMAEALRLGEHGIIHVLASEMPLLEPSSALGGLCVLEYAMGVTSQGRLSFHNLFSHVSADQVNSIGARLCFTLFESGICRREKLGILLDQGLCPNTIIVRTEVPEKDTTILSEAVEHDWPDIVSLLLARGADPGLGRTHKAITTAVLRNNVETLSCLISQLDPSFDWKFAVFVDGIPGSNAIDVAIQAGAHEALDMLFSRTNIKTIIDSRSDVNGGTPAHLAAWRGDTKSIRMLRQNGADLGRVDDRGRTILHIAAEISSPELVELAAEFCPPGATDAGRGDGGAYCRVASDGR